MGVECSGVGLAFVEENPLRPVWIDAGIEYVAVRFLGSGIVGWSSNPREEGRSRFWLHDKFYSYDEHSRSCR